MVQGKAPKPITISAPIEPAQSEPEQTRQRRKNWKKIERPVNAKRSKPKPVDAKRSKPKVAQQQPIIVPDGKPPFGLFVLGLMTVFGAISTPFLFENMMWSNEVFCCLLCNGIAIGLGIIGFYCIQYGNWEGKNGAKYSAVFMYVSAGIILLAGIASFGFWLSFLEGW